MNAAATMQVYDGYGKDCPFNDKTYRIYSDGSHYIARAATRAKAPKRTKREKTEIDDIFAFLYADGLKCDMTDKELKQLIADKLLVMKTKKIISLKPIEDRFKEEMDKYMSRVKEVRLK